MIFGSDSRIQISPVGLDRYTYSPAVQIISYFPDGTVAQGSGIVIGNNDVLTAAHVLYSRDNGGYAIAYEVTPIRMDNVEPFGVVYGSSAVVSNGWISDEIFTEDYGLITLERTIGYQTGWISPVSATSLSIGTTLSSFGYPGDLNGGNSLYRTDGTIDEIGYRLFKFKDDFDSMGGQSGSGVFLITPTKVELVGLVSYESSWLGGFNGIFAFNDTVISQINQWSSTNDQNAIVPKSADETLKPIIGQIGMLYDAIFGQNGDKESIDSLLGLYLAGNNLEIVSKTILASNETLPAAVSTQDNTTFLKYVFDDILHIVYQQNEFEYWLNALNNGYSRADGLLLCSQLPGFLQAHKLDAYVLWHDYYQDYAVEAFAENEPTTLIAKPDDSALWGGAADDVLIGSDGDDYLYGWEGNDILTGNDGDDFFAWDIGDGFDKVTDFSLGNDTLRLRSEFDWHWENDIGGNAVLAPEEGTGCIVLIGILINNVSDVNIIQSATI
ncbi:MAG: trypsin-like peptidase domain-containing protein [Sulfuricurvum sp.]|nr:trypsin-like peptidase domain-containing protein [Sulfuricurvum sp.]